MLKITKDIGSGEDLAKKSQDHSEYISMNSIPTSSRKDIRLEEHEASTYLEKVNSEGTDIQFIRDFDGSKARFDNFGRVVGAILQSDFAGFQLTHLDPQTTEHSLSELLSEMTEVKIPHEQIQLGSSKNCDGEDILSATIRMEDSSFVQHVIEKLKALPRNKKLCKVKMKPIQRFRQTGVWWRTMILSTVDITWTRSKSASLCYDGPSGFAQALKARTILTHIRIWSRTLSGSVEPEDHDECHTSLLNLENLDTRTTREEILKHLPIQLQPDGFEFMPTGYSGTDSQVNRAIERFLRSKGKLDSDDPLTFHLDYQSLQMRGTATFSNPNDVSNVEQLLRVVGVDRPARFTHVHLNYRPTANYTVPRPILEAIEPQISQLWNSPNRKCTRTPSKAVYTSERPKFIPLEVQAKSLKELAEITKPIETLLNGTVVKNNDFIVWIEEVLSLEFLAYLAMLSQTYQVHILRDTSLSQLRIYGGSTKTQEHVRRRIARKVARILTNRDITGWLEDDIQSLVITEPADCVICYSEPTRPVQLSCKHIYCQACLIDLVQFTDLRFLPLKCSGGCEHVLQIEELQKLVPNTPLEAFLHRSFQHWVTTKPDIFQNCPKPDCKQIYRRTMFTSLDICGTCLHTYCSHCGATPFHKDLSCEEHEDQLKGGVMTLQRWIAEQPNVKQCPSCTIPIEFKSGCNHMRCGACREHFCWVCLKGFGKIEKVEGNKGRNSSDWTYEHMNVVHGGIGGGYALGPDGIYVRVG